MPAPAPLNAALIGTGLVSGTYVDAIAKLAGTVRLAGALARRPASAARFVEDASAALGYRPEAYPDPGALLAARPDFAILATPPDARREFVDALAAAGVPILTEKPVARTAPEAHEIVEICARRGVPLGCVFQHRTRPSAARLREVTETGALGPLAAAEISVPWWRPQSYYDLPGRGSYARDGGGVLINQAIHTLDLALQFTGPVAEVSALAATTTLHRMEAEDFVAAGLRFANGAVGQLFATTAAFPGRVETIRLHHAYATVELRSNLLRIDWQDGRVEEQGAAAASGAGADPMAFTSDWHRAVIADFADAVRTGRAPLIPGASALPVHGLIAALERAARDGRTTRVEAE